MLKYFNEKKKWYREVLQVSLPLVMSTTTTMIMEFTDRVFLSNYSIDAIAAATPGGITAFLFICFFTGIASYVNVFIAQYTGAGEYKKIGSALWQAIWFSVFSSFILSSLYFIAVPLFRLGGHAPEVQSLEVVYFRILCMGSGMLVISSALSCFYSGMGKTRPVMMVNLAGAVFNIPLDYVLINGMGPFPELGIAGAGIATSASWGLITLLFVFLIFTRENDQRFGVMKNWRLEWKSFLYLMKFGIPGAIQFCIDIFAFTFFIFMVGRIGTSELAASNIVLSINSLAFMPMFGFSMGVSTLVGQAIGRNQPDDGNSAVQSTFHIIYIYLSILMFVFLLIPEWMMNIFKPENPSEDYEIIKNTGVILLRFVACYIFFDAHYMIFTGVLKGAGDTFFIMWTLGIMSFFVMILPIYIGIKYYNAGLYYSWGCTTFYIFSLCLISMLRYRQGRWKNMKVIEAG